MKHLNSIYITVHPDLNAADEAAARRFLDAMASRWNQTGSRPPFPAGLANFVRLMEGDNAYERLRTFYLREVVDLPVGWLRWVEGRSVKYERKDFLSAPAVYWDTSGSAKGGGNKYGHVYDYHFCEACDTLILDRQLRNPIIDYSRVNGDSAYSDFFELIVSEKVREIIERSGATDVVFRDVELPLGRVSAKRFYQIEPTRIIQPVGWPPGRHAIPCSACGSPTYPPVAYSEADVDPHGKQIDPWTFVGYHGEGPWNEIRLPSADSEGWHIARTDRIFGTSTWGGKRMPLTYLVLLRRPLIDALLDAKLKGVVYYPVSTVSLEASSLAKGNTTGV